MKKGKKQRYCNTETLVGIHTVSGTTENNIDLVQADYSDYISSCSLKKVRNKDQQEVCLRINPNKKRMGYIMESYSEFQEKMKKIFTKLRVKDFRWRRVDLSFNTMNKCYFQDYRKLNRLLIACFINMTNAKNAYDTTDFWTGKTKSLAAKSGDLEIEFYDKQDESQGKSPYYSRLEFRSVRMRHDVEYEFLNLWVKRLDRMLDEFVNVQDRYNQCLAEVYLEDLKKQKKDREFLSLNSFLLSRTECIFTRKQLLDLFLMLGIEKEKAKNRVYNFPKSYSIEFISKKDLEDIVRDIQSKIREYFSK